MDESILDEIERAKATRTLLAAFAVMSALSLAGYYVSRKVKNETAIARDTQRIADALERAGIVAVGDGHKVKVSDVVVGAAPRPWSQCCGRVIEQGNGYKDCTEWCKNGDVKYGRVFLDGSWRDCADGVGRQIDCLKNQKPIPLAGWTPTHGGQCWKPINGNSPEVCR